MIWKTIVNFHLQNRETKAMSQKIRHKQQRYPEKDDRAKVLPQDSSANIAGLKEVAHGKVSWQGLTMVGCKLKALCGDPPTQGMERL